MCGILGYSKKKPFQNINENFIDYGINLLKNRGPDNDGYFYNLDRSIGLGHTRLSILDLSKLGHQPMFSSDGRYVIMVKYTILKNFAQNWLNILVLKVIVIVRLSYIRISIMEIVFLKN